MYTGEIKELLTQDILSATVQQFSVDPLTIDYIGGFENVIYQGLRNDSPVIIRVTHEKHRTAAQIYSELHWLQYLKDNGASVCGPYTSTAGNLVETVDVHDTSLHFSLFEKAPGSMVKITQESNNIKLFQAWGKATGQLHKLTRDYQRPLGVVRREDNQDIFTKTLAGIIPDEPGLRDRVGAIVSAVRDLPKTESWYGLIHSDIHPGNFFYDGQDLHIFDFDDCCYHQLASDIAIPLYYAIWANNLETQEDIDTFGSLFARNFLIGYLSEHAVSLEQMLTIPLLLQLRDCELLGVLQMEWGNNMNQKQRGLIQSFKTRLLEERAIVNVDWNQVYTEAIG